MPFKPGQSGNPAGGQISNKDGYNLPQVCRLNSKDAIDTVLKIMRNESQSPKARLQAAGMILDRGFGKAPQLTVNSTDLKTALELTDAELASIATGSSSGAIEAETGPQTAH